MPKHRVWKGISKLTTSSCRALVPSISRRQEVRLQRNCSSARRSRSRPGCETSATISLGGETRNVSESCGEDVKGIDLGLTGGIGAEIAVSEQMTLAVDLRYTLGLLSIDETGEDDVKNRNLTLQVGVGFPIGE